MVRSSAGVVSEAEISGRGAEEGRK